MANDPPPPRPDRTAVRPRPGARGAGAGSFAADPFGDVFGDPFGKAPASPGGDPFAPRPGERRHAADDGRDHDPGLPVAWAALDNPLIDAAGRAVVVRAVIANDEGKLRPGLFARVRLTLAERENALFVPEQAIQPQGDQSFVFRLVDDGDGKTVAKLTPVTLGNRRQGEVEVIEGLSGGDMIVSAGLLKIRDGVPVQILTPAEAPAVADGKPVTG